MGERVEDGLRGWGGKGMVGVDSYGFEDRSEWVIRRDEAEDALVDGEHGEPSLASVELSCAKFRAEPATESRVADFRLFAVERVEEGAEDTEVVQLELDVGPVAGQGLSNVVSAKEQGHDISSFSMGQCEHGYPSRL